MKIEPFAGKRGAFFDLEKTLTPHAVEQEAAVDFWRRGEFGTLDLLNVAWIYLRYNLGLLGDFDALKRAGAPVFTGRDAARDVHDYAAFFERHLRPAIYPEALAAVAAFREAGVPVWIVSSTYTFMVTPYAELLGAAGHLGTTLEIADGTCTGRIVDTIWHQENKAKAVRDIAARDGLDLAESWAFGDSVNDLQMLEAVGKPRAVNPSGGLRKIAVTRGWEILRWGAASP